MCATDPSEMCWDSCYAARASFRLKIVFTSFSIRFSENYSLVMSFSVTIVWGSHKLYHEFFSNQDVSTMCAMCATDPSETCWDSCYSAQFTTNKLIAKGIFTIIKHYIFFTLKKSFSKKLFQKLWRARSQLPCVWCAPPTRPKLVGTRAKSIRKFHRNIFDD